MNQDLINTIGIKQIAREEAHLYQVSDVQGLIDTFDKEISEWSDFDSWEIYEFSNGFLRELWIFIKVRKLILNVIVVNTITQVKET